jgi:hypothetical protein
MQCLPLCHCAVCAWTWQQGLRQAGLLPALNGRLAPSSCPPTHPSPTRPSAHRPPTCDPAAECSHVSTVWRQQTVRLLSAGLECRESLLLQHSCRSLCQLLLLGGLPEGPNEVGA